MRALIVISIIVSLAATSCSRKTTPVVTNQTAPVVATKNLENEGYSRATVVDYTGLDGCKFLLQLEDGSKLQPDKLADTFQKDQLPVWIKYRSNKGGASICMSGKMVILTAIEKREKE